MTATDHPPAETEGSGKTTPSMPRLEPALRCPRCDSPNTKFCYYNNYSLSQPRHFCKSCRRYWTRGGALRNVPVGGAARKNKRIVKTISPSVSSSSPPGFNFPVSDCRFENSLENFVDGNGFKFLDGFSQNRGLNNNSCPNGVIIENGSGLITNPEINHMGSMSDYTNLASSIENLSSLNQNLHWKLQEQRIALFLGHNNPKVMMANNSPVMEKPQPVMFQNLEIGSKPENIIHFDSSLNKECAVGATGESSATDQWSFGNSTFASSSSTTMAGATSSVNTENGEGSIGISHGVQAWSDLHHHHQSNNSFP